MFNAVASAIGWGLFCLAIVYIGYVNTSIRTLKKDVDLLKKILCTNDTSRVETNTKASGDGEIGTD